MSDKFYHSVQLEVDLCHGCINCVKRCPTEAIRVRKGKAHIIKNRCIDCGECIRVCPHHAKQAVFDSLDIIKQYKYTVALPAPALFGQFNNLEEVDLVLAALLKMGFDDIFEVAQAAEIISDATRQYMKQQGIRKPVISSACPAVLRLIRVRFPELLENVLPFVAPVELAARLAKEQAAEKTHLPPEDIGCIFISPCPAKVTAAKMPLGTEKSAIDGVVAIRDVYPKLIGLMEGIGGDLTVMSKAGRIGLGWGSSGGEASAILSEQYLAADGIENVIRVLEDLEDEKLYDLDFVELNACSGGCVGGVLTVENPYVAKVKLKRLRKYRPVSCNKMEQPEMDKIKWEQPVEYEPVMELDADFKIAMEKMRRMREIQGRLKGMDCGSCGAPSCRAMAEDIVRGYAKEENCIYKLQEELEEMAGGLERLSKFLPQAADDIDN